MSKTSPKPEDVAIGARVRARRMALGMSQETLGEALGIAFQQIQKYEKGVNRIGGSRMIAIAKALRCPVSDLFGETGWDADGAAEAFTGLDAAGIKVALAISRMTPARRELAEGIVRLVAKLDERERDRDDAARDRATGREALRAPH